MVIMKNVKISWQFLGLQHLYQTVIFLWENVPIGFPSSLLLQEQWILNILCVINCLVFRVSTAQKKLSIVLAFDSKTKLRYLKGKRGGLQQCVIERTWLRTTSQNPGMHGLVCIITWCWLTGTRWWWRDHKKPCALHRGTCQGVRSAHKVIWCSACLRTQTWLDVGAIASPPTPGGCALPQVPGCAQGMLAERIHDGPRLPAASSRLQLCAEASPAASLSHSVRVQNGHLV